MQRILLAGFAALMATPALAEDAPEIGKATEVVNKVEVVAGDNALPIKKGAPVHLREKVVTGDKATSAFLLKDETKLAVGPNSQLLLDEFVYDPNPKLRKVVLTNLKGAMRFVTGKNPSKTYKIKTPTATIGIRGTMVDIYVDPKDGRTVVGLMQGRVNVCPPGSPRCREVRRIGRFLSINRDGRFRITTRPDKLLLGNAPFAAAFPFVVAGGFGPRGLRTPVRLQRRILGRVRVPILHNRVLPKRLQLPGPGLDNLLPGIGKGKKVNKRKNRRRSNNRKRRHGSGIPRIRLPNPFK